MCYNKKKENKMHYKIKVLNNDRNSRFWVGHSNSRDTFGFYFTTEKNACIFTNELEMLPEIDRWLKDNKYEFEVVQVDNSIKRNIY